MPLLLGSQVNMVLHAARRLSEAPAFQCNCSLALQLELGVRVVVKKGPNC